MGIFVADKRRTRVNSEAVYRQFWRDSIGWLLGFLTRGVESVQSSGVLSCAAHAPIYRDSVQCDGLVLWCMRLSAPNVIILGPLPAARS